MNVIILKKDRTAVIRKANPNKRDFEYNKALYILSPDRIHNFESQRGVIMDSEVIFFEDNPNALSGEDNPEDKSQKYLDDVVVTNFIQQATDTYGKWEIPTIPGIGWLFERPERIPLVLMFGWVVWIVIRNMLLGGI